jgi:hypothetical protein
MIEMLSVEGINLLIAEDPYAKTLFISNIIRSMKDSRVIYLDLDTLFTAYIRNNIIKLSNNKVDILFASNKGLEDMIADAYAIADYDANLKLIVFDSLHGFYHIYAGKGKRFITRLNQLLIFYISLLLNLSKEKGCPLLVTNVKKRLDDKEHKTNINRYLLSRSSAMLYVKVVDNILSVSVLRHILSEFNGKNIVINDYAIRSIT